jgi:fumarate hydratase class II
LKSNVDSCLLIATVLNPILGYDAVVRITRKAAEDGITPKQAAVALGLISSEEYDFHVQPLVMALGA